MQAGSTKGKRAYSKVVEMEEITVTGRRGKAMKKWVPVAKKRKLNKHGAFAGGAVVTGQGSDFTQEEGADSTSNGGKKMVGGSLSSLDISQILMVLLW